MKNKEGGPMKNTERDTWKMNESTSEREKIN